MPKKQDSHLPREAYSPEIIALLEAGTKQRIVFEASAKGKPGSDAFDTELRRLWTLRRDAQFLRRKMHDAGDPRAANLYRCECKLDRKAGTLIFQPRGTGYSDLLASAGIDAPEFPSEDFLDDEEGETS